MEHISGKIPLIRKQKVLRDKDLAELYDVETRRLKVDVRKNVKQFPTDFMYEMINEELSNWIVNCDLKTVDSKYIAHV